jgi:quinol-cytochrome oxidoreductase complex cytochrome b subunit
MSETLLDALQYYGSAAGAIAALIVSLDLGRRWTGWAFVIFVTASIALVLWGFLSEEAEGIGAQNIILFVINLVGVYRYLIRKKPPEGVKA